jgi:ferritin-like metal-binding protein YciE
MAKKKRTTAARTPDGHGAGGSRRTRSTGNGQTQSPNMIETLEEGLFAEIADALNAERQLLKTIPKLAQTAQLPRLRYVLERYVEVTEDHAERLERAFEMFGRKPQAETCEGMEGILNEAKEIAKKAGEGPVRDALIIASVQKLGHYKIAMYGTLCAWAEQTGEHDVLGMFEDSLYDEKMADRRLTRIAESSPNVRAAHAGGRERFGTRQSEERSFRERRFGE